MRRPRAHHAGRAPPAHPQIFPHFLDNVDVICCSGTATLPVFLLLLGYDIASVVEITARSIRRIFSDVSHTGGVLSYKFSSKLIQVLTAKFFGKKTLADLPRGVAVPVVCLDMTAGGERTLAPLLYSNLPVTSDNPAVRNADTQIATIVRKSFSMPGYFQAYESCVDGSVLFTQPFAAAKMLFDIHDCVLLSIGGGKYKQYFKAERFETAGYMGWARDVSGLFRVASERLADEYLQVLFGPYAFRFNPERPSRVDLDDAEKIDLLREMALEQGLSPMQEWIGQFW